MKTLSVIKNNPLPSNDDIVAFEKLRDIKMPWDYKYYLVTQNLFLSKDCLYRGKEEYKIHHFHPFDVTADISLQVFFDILKDFLENSFIPFAGDSGGWQFVISLRKKDYGKVYFCRMDEELEDALTLLADSFEEFIDGLESAPTE